MVERKHFSGAAHPALYFIYNQKDAVLVADSPHLLQKTRGRRHIATFTLHGLNNNRGNFFRRRRTLEQTIFDPIDRPLDNATCAAIVGAERIAIFVRIRHMDHVEHLSLETQPLRDFGRSE